MDINTVILPVIRSIAENSVDGAILYSQKDARVLYVNDSLGRLFDISHSTFSFQPSFFISHVVEQDVAYLKDQYRILLANEVLENVEFRIKAHDKSVRHISSNSYVIDSCVLGIFKDITRVKENEAYIVEYSSRKDTLLDMVSHNLSGPLNLLKSFSQVLQNAVKENDFQKVTDTANFIRHNTEHCFEVVNQLIEEEYLASERIFVKKTRFDLVRRAEVVIERTQMASPRKNISFSYPSRPIYMVSDEVKVFQVIHNLLSNAVKFTADEGKIQVKIETAVQTFTISVTDDGIGIPSELQPILFDKYTSAGRPGLRGEKSLGMGLYVSQKLVELLKGKITFSTKEGAGSTFTVTFPRVLN